MIHAALIGCALLIADDAAFAANPPVSLQAWWVDSLHQTLVGDGPAESLAPGELRAARGECEAIQVAVRSDRPQRVTIVAPPFAPDLEIRVRTVGRVPIQHGTHRTPPDERVALPPVDLPDPLRDGSALELEADRTECFWLDVTVPATARPGEYQSTVQVRGEGATRDLPLILRVYAAVVPFDGQLLLTNWFSVRPAAMGFGDAPVDSDAWWACARLLFDSMWAHRQNMFWTSLDAPFIKPIVTDDGALGFDFALFDAWVEAFSQPRGGARKTYIEGQPIAWREGYDGHVKARVWQIADGAPRKALLEVDDPAAREGYRVFLTTLRDHLANRGWLDRFRIHITDEPHGHQLAPYAVLAGYVREFAPEFQIMEALDVRDDFTFFDQHCDVWVPQLGRFDRSLDRLEQRLRAGREVWLYTCLFPNGRYPNRFIDYPVIKARLLHWINFRWGFTGYLHWGFNHWQPDPFRQLEPRHGLASFLPPGDAWIVYPADHGLLDSIRHEAMRDGVEDYELLRLLAARDRPKAEAIATAAVESFTAYVRDAPRFRELRRELLEALESPRE